MTSQNTYVLKHSNLESGSLPYVLCTVVVPVSHFIITYAAWWGILPVGDRDKSQNWSLIKSKFSPLFSQLRLRSPQLQTENISSDAGEYGSNGGSNPGDRCPTSNSARDFVFLFLFFSALLCCLAAFYLDFKWPGCGPYPLIVFAVISISCCFQFYRLSNRWFDCYSLTSLDSRTKDISFT
jgi:hypothetical protein